MRNLKVIVPPVKGLIKKCPGFEKKELAEEKLDAVALCEFGCLYCSSNWGNFLRIRREPFADLTEQQLGTRWYPDTKPELTFHFPDVVAQLERDLASKPRSFGEGKTLVYSMQTDGFSPSLVRDGTSRAVLELLFDRTSFRIRVLTKNAVVGNQPEWLRFFAERKERFVVGLSVGTLDDAWARRIELGTPLPSARLRALRALQDAGVATFGMLCPIFPDLLGDEALDRLVDAIRPHLCEQVWAEPYNDRTNWEVVRDGYEPGSVGHRTFTTVFGDHGGHGWSAYALELFRRLSAKAEADGWHDRLTYLLYEDGIADEHVAGFGDLSGILLQSQPDENGFSQHRGFAQVQRSTGAPRG